MQENLTSREREIFNLLLDGVPPKEIAHRLHVSSKAVDYHRGNLYGKLGIQSIQELLAKYSNGRLKADATNSPDVEPEAAPPASKITKTKRFWLLISAGALVLAVLVFLTWFIFIKPKSFVASAENQLSFETSSTTQSTQGSFSLTFGPHAQDGWFNRFYPSSFRNTRITEGDIYTVSCSFTSNVDFDWFQVLLYDDSKSVYEPLSPTVAVAHNVKANIAYSGTVTLIAYRTAANTSPSANMLHMDAIALSPDQQPTLTFTKLEVIKTN